MTLPPPEVIETARLILRRSRADDTADKFLYASDPEVARYMDWTMPRDLNDMPPHERGAARWESGEEDAWVITVKPHDRAVGNLACRVDGHVMDFGYLLARECWGHGYATEACRALMEWAAGLEQIHRIWATCDVENAASVRVLEKLGMTREGLLRGSALRPNLAPGVPRDALLYPRVRGD